MDGCEPVAEKGWGLVGVGVGGRGRQVGRCGGMGVGGL